ncbi:hypothetical protein AOLI_G00242740 [Acnodon oligacanthus]
MTAMELRERKRNPEEEAAYFSSACKDKDGFDVKYINPDTDDSLGRLVNDDHVRPDSKMKTITVAGKPHLCLFATRSITPGEEITYNYGDSEWPWRCKNIAETDALVSANSVLAKKNQMQPEELLPQVPRDATHKIKSEADVLVTTIPLLTEKDQMQPEELLPQFSREATHENISDQRTCMWHVTTVSQILNLKNSELDQVADFLGHDIRVHHEINSTDDSDGSEPENAAMDDAMTVPRQTGCEVISFADTEPEAPTVNTQTFMDEVDTPTVHPLGNESHEDADVEVEAEDINTLTDTQLDDTKATFSQTLGNPNSTNFISSGKEACFEIYTCHGAPISDLSMVPDEDEVLMPPHELFESEKLSTWPELSDCKAVHKLTSKGKKSNMKCEYVNFMKQQENKKVTASSLF